MTAASARELVEVVARLGDTILEVKLVAAGRMYRVGEAALPAVPGTARVGLVDVTISPVSRPARSLPYATNSDRRTLPYLAMSLAAHVVICGLAIAKPVGLGGAAVAFTDRPINTPRVGWHVGPAAGGGATTTIAMALEVGPKQPKRDPRRMHAIADGESGMTDDDARGRIAALVSSMDAASSYDQIDTTGGGGGGGDGGGGFGGSREGSVGTGGLIGDGRYATNVAGRGNGSDWTSAGMGGGSRGRESGVPTVILCGGPAPCVVAIGELDKAIIRRYLRRQLPKIQYCYEKQLLVDGTIAGNVATEFVIAADGKVVEATSQGMDESVAECVTSVIRAIEFPRSKTQTRTRVTYPFGFRTH